LDSIVFIHAIFDQFLAPVSTFNQSASTAINHDLNEHNIQILKRDDLLRKLEDSALSLEDEIFSKVKK